MRLYRHVPDSAVSHLQNSLSVCRDGVSNQVYTFFRFSGEKECEILVDEMPAFIKALEELNSTAPISDGMPPVYEAVRRTASIDPNGRISFQLHSTESGFEEPTIIHDSEIKDIVRILRGALPQIEAAAKHV